ncbi:MAG: hypothetical protein K5912_01640 [Alphaproteobacteria bacterium]|nr:hypothetical protein [Alphaproteobacteria bacterium]
MSNETTSTIGLLKRVRKTKKNRYGIMPVKQIPGDNVCVVCLGGNGSRSDKAANGNAKIVGEEVIDYLGVDIPLYSVRYDFAEEDAYGQYARYKYLSEASLRSASTAMGDFQRYLSLYEDNVTAQFKRVLNRLLLGGGKKRSVDSIDGNLRDLKIFINENPAKIVSKMNKMLYENMLKVGYTAAEADIIWQRIQQSIVSEHTEYINDLFEATLLPRISDQGKRLSLDAASRRMRKINFVTHCHGAYVAKQLEEKTRRKMDELGYSADEIKQVLSQMLVVAHAPSCRFEKSDAEFISFMSAFDNIVDTPANWVRAYIETMRNVDVKYMVKNKLPNMEHAWMKYSPIYLDKKHGNMFMIPSGFDLNLNTGGPSSEEHENTHYDRIENQNNDGYYLNLLASDILSSGIRNSLEQDKKFSPLPCVRELLRNPDSDDKDVDLDFEMMKRDGDKFMSRVYIFARRAIQQMREKDFESKAHKENTIKEKPGYCMN